MSKMQKAVRNMYARGYRITPDGRFLNPSGVELLVKKRSNHFYPQSQIIIDGEKYNFQHHRLAAYCQYGEAMFDEGIVVRHLDANPLNIEFDNIALGTRSENEMDKPPEMRSRVCSEANRKRKDVRRLTMRRFTDTEIRDIRERLNAGELGVKVAQDYGVVKDTIYQIRRGQTYRDVV